MIISKGAPVFHHNGQVVHCDHEAIPECIRRLNNTTSNATYDSSPIKLDTMTSTTVATSSSNNSNAPSHDGYNYNAPVVNEGGVNTVEQGRAVEFVMRWRNIFETHFKPSYIPWKPSVGS